jgi:hypothetical protein
MLPRIPFSEYYFGMSLSAAFYSFVAAVIVWVDENTIYISLGYYTYASRKGYPIYYF